MNVKRIVKHLLTAHGNVNRAFPRKSLLAIEKAIKASEAAHVGEIRFAVEGALDGTRLFRGQSARERAIEVFSKLRVWDTEHNNGVLVYLLLADRSVEIIADRAAHTKVDSHEWQGICRGMERAFGQANYEQGVLSGLQAVTGHLVKHFPPSADGRNELRDKPVIL